MGQEKYENKTLLQIHEEMAAIHKEALLAAVPKALNDGTPVLDVVDALRSGLKVVGDDFEEMVRFFTRIDNGCRPDARGDENHRSGTKKAGYLSGPISLDCIGKYPG